ncbi:hypothetical protein QP164_03615 [Sphingomonas sp. LR59]
MSIDFTLPHCCTEDAAPGSPGHVLIMATIIMRPLRSIQMDTGLRRWLTERRNAGFQPGTKSTGATSEWSFPADLVFSKTNP